MKLAVVVLTFLGLLAAGAAVLLVQTIQTQKQGEGGVPQVKVLVALEDIPALSIMRVEQVKVDEAPLTDLPPGYLTDPIQVVGKVLALGVVKGQVMTRETLIAGGSSEAFTAVIPPGMRAFTITLSSRDIGGGLVYPGCIVDILAAFQLPRTANGDALSTTLMQNIQVLAIENKSVVSKRDPEKETGPPKTQSQRSIAVTLLVTSKQASALQLSIKHGVIAVALRNPLDKAPASEEGVVLSAGRMATEDYDHADLSSRLEQMLQDSTASESGERNKLTAESSDSETTYTVSSPPAQAEPATWDVTIIRGQQVNVEKLKIE